MRTLSITLVCFLSLLNLYAQPVIKNLRGAVVEKGALESAIKQIVDTSRIVGLSVVIINDNKVVYNHTFGLKNKETNALLNDTSIMYAASFTKPISAYIFLKLVEKGIFNLDTPVYKYLKKPIGEYEKWKDLATDTAFAQVTPRMLLSHSSGLPVLRFLYNDKVNLIAPPGKKFYYSNEGMNLLGVIIEEQTGQKLENIAKKLVLDPLQMNHSSYVWQPSFESDYALGYMASGKLYGAEKRVSARAAGSMVTIASDYAKFVIALMQQNGFNKKLFNQMFTPKIRVRTKRGFGPLRDSITTENDNMQLSWGLGVGLLKTPYGKAIFHTGHNEGWHNYFVAYPEKKTAIVFMSNSLNYGHVADKLLQVTIGDPVSPLKWLGFFDPEE